MTNTVQPQVLFEDEYMIAVDKPAGMIVNRADTTKNLTVLQDWIEEKFTKVFHVNRALANNQSDFVLRSGIVHRIDKETSGVLLVAKSEETFLKLQRQFKERIIKKTYTALVHGKIIPEVGEVNVPVGRIPWDRKKFGVVVEGKPSVTHYKMLQYKTLQQGKKLHDYSLLEVYPHTGRTHQIRVHMRYLGFPIAGDALYAGRKNLQLDRKYVERHFLHASKLTLLHPVSEQQLTVSSPLPDDLRNFLDMLKDDT